MPTEFSGGRCLGWMWYLYNDFWFFVVLVIVVGLFTGSERRRQNKKHQQKMINLLDISAWLILAFFILFSPIYKTWLNAVCGVYATNMGIFYQGWIEFSYNTTSDVCGKSYWRDDYYNPLPRASAYANYFKKLNSKVILEWLPR